MRFDDEAAAAAEQSRETIDAVRRYRNLTRSELGRRLGAGNSTVFSWASGARVLDVPTLGRVAAALDVPVYVLLMPPTMALRAVLDADEGVGNVEGPGG